MRVGVLATELDAHGGIQRYGTAVVEALVAEGHEVFVVETIGARTRGRQVRLLLRLARRARSCDVLWILHPRLAAAGVLLGKVLRLPTIVSTYGFENWGRYPVGARLGLSRADAVTAISMFSKALMGPVGADAALLRPACRVATVEGGDWQPSPQLTVLFVGRLDEAYKGIELVFALAERFRPRTDVRFVLAGAGPAAPSVEELLRRATNVELVESPQDVELDRLYVQAAVVVLPSAAPREGDRWLGGEGFGIVLLEAASAGTPVLASDEGACPETVALLGNGMISPVTAEAFGDRLEELLGDADLRHLLGARGRSAASRLTPERFRREVAAVLDRATGPRGSAR